MNKKAERGNEESGALCNCQSTNARSGLRKFTRDGKREREGEKKRRFTHVPEEFSDAGTWSSARPVYNIMQQLRNNVGPPGLATLRAAALFYQRYSSSINSFLSLLALSRDARFSGQDLWNGTLYSSILAYASIYSLRGKAGLWRHFIPKVSWNSCSASVTPLQDASKVSTFLTWGQSVMFPTCLGLSILARLLVKSRFEWEIDVDVSTSDFFTQREEHHTKNIILEWSGSWSFISDEFDINLFHNENFKRPRIKGSLCKPRENKCNWTVHIHVYFSANMKRTLLR